MGTLRWILVWIGGAGVLVFLGWAVWRAIEEARISRFAQQYFGELLEGAVRAANQGRPPHAQIKSVDDVSHADLPNVIRGLLLERGVDITAPLDERGEKQRTEVEEKVKHWLCFGADDNKRANYERVVERAEEILADREGKYTESQKAAAGRILHMPIPNLGNVSQYEMADFFERTEKFAVPGAAAAGGA